MDESEAPASSDLSEELQCAFWGLPLGAAGPPRPGPAARAAAAGGGGRQLGGPCAPAERAERVFAHMLHCGAPAWTLRLGLMRCGGQAVAAVAAGGAGPPPGAPRAPAGGPR